MDEWMDGFSEANPAHYTYYIEYGDVQLIGCKEIMQQIGLCERKQKQVQMCMCGWQSQEDLQQWKIQVCKPPQRSLNLVHLK